MPRTYEKNSVEKMLVSSVSMAQGDGCWTWTGPTQPSGYGNACIAKKQTLAHRLFYQHFKGPIPSGFQVDHLCKNRACVNPQHLEAVTPAENNARSTSPSALNAMKLECMHGHGLAGANLYVTTDGRRQCRTCRAEAVARSVAKSKEAALA